MEIASTGENVFCYCSLKLCSLKLRGEFGNKQFWKKYLERTKLYRKQVIVFQQYPPFIWILLLWSHTDNITWWLNYIVLIIFVTDSKWNSWLLPSSSVTFNSKWRNYSDNTALELSHCANIKASKLFVRSDKLPKIQAWLASKILKWS